MFGNRNWLIIAIAAVLGIAAVIIANSYLSGVEEQQNKAAEEGRLVQIAVARAPMTYGTVLTTENIRMVSWPATSMPTGAFQSTKGLFNGQPRVALRPIEVGEPILPGKITGPGGRASISNLIETDMRAVALRITDVAGVAGFILPGDYVDVLLTRTPVVSDGSAQQITDVIMPNVRVIAVDQNSNEAENKPNLGKTITVTVDQEGAQKLALAGQVGTLSMALRNPASQDQYSGMTVGVADLGQGDISSSYMPPSRRVSTAGLDSGMYMPVPKMSGSSPVPVVTMRPVRPPNSVSVQVVRGTNSSTMDVKRY